MSKKKKQVKKIKTSGKIKEKDDKIAELTNLAKRTQADFENYKKRVDKEQKDYVTMGKVLVVKRLLPLMDSFNEALKDEAQAELIKPIYKQLKKVFDDFHLEHMEVVGDIFDPHLHECIIEEESEEPKGKIIDEIQRGYKMDDFIVRHAKVKISKGISEVKDITSDDAQNYKSSDTEDKKEDDNIKEDS